MDNYTGKDRTVALLIVMQSLLEILGGGILSEDDYNLLKLYVTDLGFQTQILNEQPLIKLLQNICKQFSEIDLSEYEAEDYEP